MKVCVLNMSCTATLSFFEFPVMHYFCLKRRVIGDAVGGIKILVKLWCIQWLTKL